MTVVFGPDNFTVAANTNINAYPAGNVAYAYNLGTTTHLTVNAANDRVQNTQTSDKIARCTRAGVPSGDQEATAACYGNTTTGNSGDVAVRCATDNTSNCYFTYTNAGNFEIWRVDGAAFTLMVSAARTYVTGTNTKRLKATGTTTVDLEAQIGTTAVLTTSDATANRKQSGPPGIYIFNTTANIAYVDDFQINDLGRFQPPIVGAQAVKRARFF